MPPERDEDAILPVMDSVQPLISKGDFASACDVVREAIGEALHAGRSEDAATLSTILGSFLSIAGADEAALEAFQRAEFLEPANRHHALATARHLLTRLRNSDAAEEKALATLDGAGTDRALAHAALAVLGQCSLARGHVDKALAYLHQAHAAAIEGEIHPSAWDTFLVEEIARIGPKSEIGRAYAQALLDRARARSDVVTEKRGRALLSQLGAG